MPKKHGLKMELLYASDVQPAAFGTQESTNSARGLKPTREKSNTSQDVRSNFAPRTTTVNESTPIKRKSVHSPTFTACLVGRAKLPKCFFQEATLPTAF